MTFDKVRTRFAPSPTGYMHVGNLRTALYAYLLAKKNNGTFILRIEDTDRERYVEGAVDIIYNTLRKTGLIWDEGPDIGGPVGPYVQSERMGMFKKYALQLVESGHAYYCFCDKERLEEVRTIQQASGISPRYDGHCRNLSPEEIKEKLDAGVPYVIRQKMPTEGTTSFDDEVFGTITVENSTLDDQILIKTDGMPTYNFANVVDDHTMGITHVIRGNEYLSSTPKYNLLYDAFGWQKPVYVHCSPVMKNHTEKLSKRNGDASFEDLIAKGYLTEAIINYIALLGWSPKGENEVFELNELIQEFDIDGISKSPAIFDTAKLTAINGAYIRKLSIDEYLSYATPYIRQTCKREDIDLEKLAKMLQPRTEIFTDIPDQVDFIDQIPDYSNELYCHKKMKTNEENSLESLKEILPVLEGLQDWNFDNIHNSLFALIEKLGVKNGLILWPLRVCLSGKQFTPGGGVELAELLGKEESIRRIKHGIEQLSK
ncbi:glutamate--tRNA ligase [Paludicola sp. MB14-C6]|uniref:glutamate--tRNA ligase n=1 Tax=Paludihabitans sp. MB14-C6 TaxID=3070656 RepID=UPI0027DB168F|nr:glutamate--tRNA ligase [Paludicola sp. MB14-C6]WMJ23248.1 glutamate--tRNA ligase [Paludicola sp. MB14-C6]